MKAQLSAFAVTALLSFGASSSSVAADADADKIIGTWVATVRAVSPPASPTALDPFLSIATFMPGGQVIEDANGRGLRTESQGAWFKVGPHEYIRTTFLFGFVAPRVFSTKVITKIVVSEDGQTYDAIAMTETYDPSGTSLANSVNTSHARRCDFNSSLPACMGL